MRGPSLRIARTHRFSLWGKSLARTTRVQRHSPSLRFSSGKAKPIPPVDENVVAPPDSSQLRAHFLANLVRMAGFGFMDQSVMLQAGHAIDMTIGVAFGLSTLTAAALGEVCSNGSAVLFGGALEQRVKAAGLATSNLTAAQRNLPIVKRVQMAGSFAGVLLGCCLGMVNLFFIDTERTLTLKQKARNEEHEFAFEVAASNRERDDATVFTVRGPDVDGILASMTNALAGKNYSLVELSAHRAVDPNESCDAAATLNSSGPQIIEDIFAVVRQGTHDKIPDHDLDETARTLLEATIDPANSATLTMKVQELEETNSALQARIQKLENLIKERNIKITPSSSRNNNNDE